MHRVHLTGGPTLVLDAYAHVIGGSANLTVQGQTSTFVHALEILPSARPDVLLLHANALADAKPAVNQQRLRRAAARSRLAVIGDISTSDIASYMSTGVTGILSQDLDVAQFLTALELVSRGGLVIAPAPELASPLTASPAPMLALLSARERQILTLVTVEPHNEALAGVLGLSPLTVKTHVNRIMRKLGTSNRAQLVAVAYESGLVVPGIAAGNRTNTSDRAEA